MQAASIKLIGDWKRQTKTMLDQALQVSQDVFDRTAGEACKHAVILMAQSLASKNNAITPISKPKRPVLQGERGEYVEVWRQGSNKPQKLYKWMFSKVHDRWGNVLQVKNFTGASFDDAGWEKAQIIKSAGLARRSWMWGLASWGGRPEGKEISGTSEVIFSQHSRIVSATKRNKLGYIMNILPAGWAEEAATRATNKIMGHAARRMERFFISAVRSGAYGTASKMRQYFLPEAA